jgi:hypothetical protein
MTSRNPSVVTSPVSTPFASRSAFVATVVPWETWLTSPGSTSALASIVSMPSIAPFQKSGGVVGTFSWKMVPASSSTSRRSVNVPPMSNPSR